MNHPIQLRPQRLLSLLVCISSVAMASTSLFGQPIIQRTNPVFQQPSRITPIYPARPVQIVQPQAPIQNGPIIYGQPIPTQNRRIISSQPIPIQNGPIINGRIINGQPIPIQRGRIINGPIVNGPVINGPIISGPITQPGVVITPQPQSVIVNPANANQDDEIKRLNAEIERLKALAQGSGKQSEEVERLQRELYKARLDLSEMQRSAAAKSDDNSATMALNDKIQQQRKEIDRLGANYEKALQSKEDLNRQIKTLTDEGLRLKTQLAQMNKPNDSMAASGLELQQLRSSLTTSSNALNEIKQKNAAMTTEYNRMRGELNRLQGLNETANTDNGNLNLRNDELLLENQRLAAELGEYSDVDVVNAITEVRPVEVSQTSFVADQDLSASNLERKNKQLLALNEQTNNENRLLNRRIAELEGNVSDLSIDDDDRVVAKTSVVSNLDSGLYDLSSQVDVTTGKYNILRWLIPFLGIGLFVGLYVFLTEEYLGTSRALVAGVDDRDDRERRSRS